MKKILVLAVLFLCSCSGQNVLAIRPMMTYGAPAQPSATALATLIATPSPSVIASTLPASDSLLRVVVTAETVNIRDGNLRATGKWLTKDAVLAVKPYQDGWYQIVGGEYDGDLIWSGCTSMNENRTCKSK